MDNFHTRENISDSEVLLKISLPVEAFDKSYEALLQDRVKATDLKGFRKGMVPGNVVEGKMKELLLLETFERIAPYYVNAAIIKENLEPISPPVYKDLSKLEKGAQITFNVSVTVMPTFKLGDLKQIKLETVPTEATEKEINEAIENLLKAENEKATSKKPKVVIGDEATQKSSDSKSKPEADDKWAAEMGTKYKLESVSDLKSLKTHIKKTIETQKESIARQRQATEAVREAAKLSKIEIPEAAVKYEAEQREQAFMGDLKKMNLSVRDFLKRQGLTIEQLREMWKRDAKEALENDVLFKLYAEERKLEVSPDELAEEVERTKEYVKSQNKGKEVDLKPYDEPHWQEHIRSFLLKQKASTQFVNEVLGIRSDGSSTTESKPTKQSEKSENSTAESVDKSEKDEHAGHDHSHDGHNH